MTTAIRIPVDSMMELIHTGMTTLLLLGATGAIGERVLEAAVADDRVQSIVTLGRRAPALTHPKLHSHSCDLSDEHAVATAVAALPDGEVAFLCALGTTMKAAGSEQAFIRVDKHMPLVVARALAQRGHVRAGLVSSMGARSTGSASNVYLRTKSELEADLSALLPNCTIVRPSLLDRGRDDGRLGEKLALMAARPLFRLVGPHHRFAPIHIDVVARALLRSTLSASPGVHIHESDALHALGA
jgi:uncharacterized protein YbjT (DUF2867 family)